MRQIKLLIAALMLISPFAANADPIVVDGLEWRQLSDTFGFSYDQVETVCDRTAGACNGSLNGVDFNGWLWASIQEVDALIGLLTPYAPPSQPLTSYSYSELDSAWAPSFFSLFESTGPITYANGDVAGFSRYGFRTSCSGFGGCRREDRTVGVRVIDYTDRADTAQRNYWDQDDSRAGLGVWLYRPTSVPEPGTLALLGIGLFGMGLARRRKI